jgi:hypothetical protein
VRAWRLLHGPDGATTLRGHAFRDARGTQTEDCDRQEAPFWTTTRSFASPLLERQRLTDGLQQAASLLAQDLDRRLAGSDDPVRASGRGVLAFFVARERSTTEGPPPWAIPWPCVHEFLAIVTHPRIFKTPTPLAGALDQAAAWFESPSLAMLQEGDGVEPRDHAAAARLAGRLHLRAGRMT